MLNVSVDSFFKPIGILVYKTIWDKMFQIDLQRKYLFYSCDPDNVIHVTIYSDKNNLRKEDVLITLGSYHNKKNETQLRELIEKFEDIIFKVCKERPEMEFLFNLDNLSVIEFEDFTDAYPNYGLNTFFTYKGANFIFCLVNVGENIYSNGELLNWFFTHLESCKYSLIPVNGEFDYARHFMLTYTSINNNLPASKFNNIADMDLGDNGMIYLPFLTIKTTRLKELFDKSVRQFSGNKNRGK